MNLKRLAAVKKIELGKINTMRYVIMVYPSTKDITPAPLGSFKNKHPLFSPSSSKQAKVCFVNYPNVNSSAYIS